jgi:tetratricopeptide (TPR) repeat protein
MIEDIIRLLARLPELEPIEILPPRLDELFRQLQTGGPVAEAYAIEDEIWLLWTSHDDAEASAHLDAAIAAIASKRFDDAQEVLDDLVRAQPLWPEAWNKRATLAFLRGRDDDSVRDIRRTLEMEPRHFGALSGLAQICLRNGSPDAARLAFEAALRLNPHLAAVRVALAELRRQYPQTLH